VTGSLACEAVGVERITLLSLAVVLLIAGCGDDEAAGPSSVADLLGDPVYDEEVVVEGIVDRVGELLCPCFELSSEGSTVMVWHDLMAARGEELPAVDITGIGNGDTVEVAGWLLDQQPPRGTPQEFRATDIVTVAPGPAGLPNPASVFCEERGGMVEIRSDAEGGQVGYCVFPEGSECEEWAYYRGECVP
jgi:putative hemolysin